MPRYVDIELYDSYKIVAHNDDVGFKCEDLPTVDVTQVKHARWITKEPLPRTYGRSRAMCERCGGFALYEFINAGSFGEQLSKYCPDCGAKMDLEVDK